MRCNYLHYRNRGKGKAELAWQPPSPLVAFTAAHSSFGDASCTCTEALKILVSAAD